MKRQWVGIRDKVRKMIGRQGSGQGRETSM